MRAMRNASAMLLVALALAGCHERPAGPNHTAVLGGYGPSPASSEPQLTDAQGQAIPRPPAPAGTPARVVRLGDAEALAVWVRDGHVVASMFARPGGWSEARPLEEIFGQASDPQLAGNGQEAMAVWRHTVGSIQSLRFSRFAASSGWSVPDVMPGALPRPDMPGSDADAPQLSMDAQGNVTARWPSGFAAREEQIARYTPGQGWSRALSEPVASASTGSPAPPAPSSAR